MGIGDESFEGALRELAAAPLVHRDELLAELQLRVGTRIGERYELVRRVGAGGMGVVFAAYDLHLDREVALKVHATRPTPAQVERMLREAQSMAAVAHPNVAAVFDVGRHEGWLWVAMELVEGGNARDWISGTRPGWRQLQRLFVMAGRGLAAAHAAGIVHRDFKPANILVSLDAAGRLTQAKVADFGLALSAGSRVESSGSGSKRTSRSLTETGTVLGTAGYMAPEQSLGTAVDGRADQYAFCVSLLEALVWHSGGDPEATLRLDDIRDARELPSAAAEVLRRGLQKDPADRYGSMTDLLARLDARPSRAPMALAIAAAALVAGGVAWAASSGSEFCAPPTDSAQVWSAQRRATIERKLASADEIDVAATRDQVDRYVGRWRGAWVQVCEGADADDTLLDRQYRCLRDHLSGLDATLSALDAMSGAEVGRAAAVLPKVESLEACIDAAQLADPVPLPSDPQAAERARELLTSLRQWPALEAAGAFVEAEVKYAEVVRQAVELDHPQLIARSRFVHGSTLASLGKMEEARAEFEVAFETAQSCGYGHIAYQTATTMVDLVGVRLGDQEQGWIWLRHAESLSSRATSSTESRMHLLRVKAQLLEKEGRLEEALTATDGAIDLVREFEDGRMQHGGLLTDRSQLLLQLERYPEALEAARAAKTVIVDRLGDEHPMVGLADTTVASALEEAGRAAEAEAPLRNALRIFENTLGPTNPQTGIVAGMLGEHLAGREIHDQALPHLERAAEVLRGAGAATRAQVGTLESAIGRSASATGDSAHAIDAFRRALAIHESNPAKEAGARVDLAEALLANGDQAEAGPLLERAGSQARERDDEDTLARIDALSPTGKH